MFQCVFMIGVLLGNVMGAQVSPSAPPDTAFTTVSYIEVVPSSRGEALSSLRDYRAAVRGQDGHLRLELFERAGRPGHFALVEIWRDLGAFDARDRSVPDRLLEALEPIRSSNYDQRPYKVLTLDSRRPTPDGETVYVLTHVDVSPAPEIPMLLQRLAEASRGEEGNLRFDVLQHTMRSNHFTVIEAWRNREALDAHAAARHTRRYRDELGPSLGSPLDERLYLAVE